MKTFLLVVVLLGGVLAVSAAAVEAAKPAEPEPVEPAKPVEDVEAVEAVEDVEAAPQQLHEDYQLAEDVIPKVPEGRFMRCPNGWTSHKNGCYLYVTSSQTWTAAAAHCSSMGATLASVHDAFDYSFLQDMARQQFHHNAWIGGFNFQGWRWMDGSSFNYNNWYTVHSTSGNALCIRLNSREGWGFCNHVCGNLLPSICMKRVC